MPKLFTQRACIRRNQVEALLADGERLLTDVFDNDSHNRFDRGRLYQRGQTALRHIASARLLNDPKVTIKRRNPL